MGNKQQINKTNSVTTQIWNEIYAKIRTDTDGIKQMIKNGVVSMNDTDKNGDTLLHKTALFGNIDIVRLCVNMGSDLKRKNKENQTALDWADQHKKYHIAQLLRLSEISGNIGERITTKAEELKKENGI